MKKNYTRPILILTFILFSNVVGFAQVTTTFSYTGGIQTYTVPNGVTFLDVTVKGAEGGTGTGSGGGAAGGQGSIVSGRLTVTPGTILYISVGSAGTPFSAGFNGGGNPGTGGSAGGGGATDIRIGGTTTSNRVVVAAGGGGGGGGALTAFAGGAGGGGTSGNGQDGAPSGTLGGKGGTQAVGGPGGGTAFCSGSGVAGNMGSFGQGANGAGNGGAGGGGFFGGGSGGTNSGGTCNNGAGGGGGGSSMISSSVVSNAVMTQGGNTGNGTVTIITPQAPTATTSIAPPPTITGNTATVTGVVADNGANTSVVFEYSNSPGLSTGVMTGLATPATVNAGDGATAVTGTLPNLLANTTYYYRVKAQNSVGITNGAILTFTTPNTQPVLISGPAQTITMCQNTKDYQLSSLLHVNDTDPAQSITWSVASMPDKNGSLGGFSSANTSVAGSSNISPGNAITYTPITGFKGTEIFKIQVSDGKASDTITFTATVNPLPAPIITRSGPDLMTTSPFAIYQWYRNTIAIVGATNQTYTMTEGGDYTVTVTDNNGCITTSNIYKYPTVSVDEVNAGTFHVYPNPATSVLFVEAPAGSSISIMAMDGKLAIAQAAGRVDVSGLAPGIYALRIYGNNGALLHTRKLVKVAE
ncbi:MAG: hypothetical protein K0R82_853 [Flavipsychrobacter sp.]|jgi:hypothetical protein|nr:hypothetical protein [Flavipsychrobacter sp.]